MFLILQRICLYNGCHCFVFCVVFCVVRCLLGAQIHWIPMITDVNQFCVSVHCFYTANTLAAFSGVMGPVVVSFLVTTWPGVLGWRIAFILTFYMCIVFTTIWYYYIKAEIVPALNTPAAESR